MGGNRVGVNTRGLGRYRTTHPGGVGTTTTTTRQGHSFGVVRNDTQTGREFVSDPVRLDGGRTPRRVSQGANSGRFRMFVIPDRIDPPSLVLDPPWTGSLVSNHSPTTVTVLQSRGLPPAEDGIPSVHHRPRVPTRPHPDSLYGRVR